MKIKALFFCLTNWRVVSALLKESPDVIVGFGFAEKVNCGASRPTEAIARKIEWAKTTFCTPLIIQYDIAPFLSVVADYEVAHESPEVPRPTTRSMMEEVKKICDENGWRRVFLVAHPDHMWRVRRVAEKIGIEVVGHAVSECLYDQKSICWWTRHRLLFLMWELLVRTHHVCHGWM